MQQEDYGTLAADCSERGSVLVYVSVGGLTAGFVCAGPPR
jgi:hypothetical protein